MNIEQIYTGCLAQGAYYIESNGEVAIIDPLRETEHYIARAKHDGAEIKYIFETHFHADFVSGHITLAARSGATIVYGPTAKTGYKSHIAKDGEQFQVGDITITALHTPGHTMESTTYLLKDKDGKDHCIFSGDTLFLGDVGRPDLAQKAATMTQEDLAGILFDSLRTKIMPLADDVIVYPAHGAGSACGKNMMKETVDILGNQKRVNYALRADMTREEFIQEVTDGLASPPAYFPLNVAMNKDGYANLSDIIKKGSKGLSPAAFETTANETEAIIIDTRHQTDFVKGFIPQSIFIGIDGGFAPWVGALIKDTKQPILLIAEEGRVEEVITRLGRVGFDNTIGYLAGGFDAWKEDNREIDTILSIPAAQFEQEVTETNLSVFDVRKKGEWETQHLAVASHVCLSGVTEQLAEFPKEKNFYVHCAGGYRSVIASSILKMRGYHNVIDIAGGFDEIKKTNLPMQNVIEA
jgi:glyoxylase-like metal-dependent hydrolase (beta-lactamase superfamily II)/rhodanese-related sulfurtransferase|tara:strand:+ start:3405 stop:4805 length:1401 start_codon:yes stop_codon:yes gene_type:complete